MKIEEDHDYESCFSFSSHTCVSHRPHYFFLSYMQYSKTYTIVKLSQYEIWIWSEIR